MPVKSVQTRKVKVKRTPVSKSGAGSSHDEEAVPIISVKTKMPVELDEPEVIGVVVEEKSEEDLIAAEEETDELGLDDAGLEEELDPFNDKWEA